MHKASLITTTVLGTLLVFSMWASAAGFGITHPDKEPPSLREGSAQGRLAHGHHRTRYFIGGGFARGK